MLGVCRLDFRSGALSPLTNHGPREPSDPQTPQTASNTKNKTREERLSATQLRRATRPRTRLCPSWRRRPRPSRASWPTSGRLPSHPPSLPPLAGRPRPPFRHHLRGLPPRPARRHRTSVFRLQGDGIRARSLPSTRRENSSC